MASGLTLGRRADAVPLDLPHFGKLVLVALGTAEASVYERADQLSRELRPDHTSPEAQDVEVIVLDALMRGVGVTDRCCADTANLSRRDRNPRARAAHENAALRSAVGDRPRHRLSDDRVVIGRAEVQRFVSGVHHLADDHVVQCHARVVKPASDPHAAPPCDRSSRLTQRHSW